MSDLLLCFSELDGERVKPIERALFEREYQIATYQFKDYTSIETQKLKAKVQKARAVIVFWSVKTTLAYEVYKTLNTFIHSGKIVSVMLDNLRPGQIPAPLTDDDFSRFQTDRLNDQNPAWTAFLEKIADRVNPLWMTDEVRAKVQEIDYLQTKYDAAMGDCARLQKLLDEEGAAHEEAREKQAALLVECGELKREIDHLNQELLKTRKRAASLEAELAELSPKQYSHAALAGAMVLSLVVGAGGLYFAGMRPLEGALLTSETSLEATKEQLGASEQEAKSLTEKLAGVEGRLAALQSKYDAEVEQLASVRDELKAYKTTTGAKLARLQDEVAAFESSKQQSKKDKENFALLTEKLSETQTELSSVQTALGAVQEELASTKEKAEADIAGLNKTIDNLKAQLKKGKK